MLRPSRSSLFVPGNRAAWIEKAAGYGADTLILDLEDSVPDPEKAAARPIVRAGIKALAKKGQAAGPGGDAARAIGYTWSKEGTETLFLRCKVLLDARAAGVPYPTISSWWNIKDLEGLERDATWNRQLGYRGQTVMHPTHVPIVNAVFTPSDDEIGFHRGLIEAMEEAQRRGIAAVTYKGDMVDEAMLKTSRELLDFARSIGVKV